MRRKLVWIGAVAVAVAFGGYKAAEIYAESRVRERIDATVATMGLGDRVTYGAVDVDLIGAGASVSDFVFSEQGVPVWRIDRLAVTDYAADAQGRPVRFAGEIGGAHLAFAAWAKACAAQGIACEYAADAEMLAAQGMDELLVDAALDYRIDDAAKTIAVGGELTLRDVARFALKGRVIGIDQQALAEAAGGAERALAADIPPAMALVLMGVSLGRTAERVAVADLGFSMRDLGGARRSAVRIAEAERDPRPVDAVLAEQLAEAKAVLQASAPAWMPPEFVAAMAAALDPFVWDGKPYTLTMAQGAPVDLLRRGQAGLELPPEIFTPAALFAALTPRVSNAPLP